jgi:uncharacterized membrane protein
MMEQSGQETSRLKSLLKRWFIDAFTGMAQGLFVTLIAGLILKQIGALIGKETVPGSLLILVGNVASSLTGAGIGVGIAKQLKAGNLVVFSALIAGILGANSAQIISSSYLFNTKTLELGSIAFRAGDPIGAYITALFATELGIFLSGKTKLDIIVIPLSMMIATALLTISVCPPVISLMGLIGEGINRATELRPFVMGVIIAVTVGLLLTLPTSSAAICIAIGIDGLAGGAAVVGCCCQMVGFAVQSFRENRVSGLIAQGLGTSMLQIPNLMKKPIILVPPVIASGICGPLSTLVFHLQCGPSGAGMGTAGLVGVLTTVTSSSGKISEASLVAGVILLEFVLPALICLGISEFFRKKGWFQFGDLQLP